MFQFPINQLNVNGVSLQLTLRDVPHAVLFSTVGIHVRYTFYRGFLHFFFFLFFFNSFVHIFVSHAYNYYSWTRHIYFYFFSLCSSLEIFFAFDNSGFASMLLPWLAICLFNFPLANL